MYPISIALLLLLYNYVKSQKFSEDKMEELFDNQVGKIIEMSKETFQILEKPIMYNGRVKYNMEKYPEFKRALSALAEEVGSAKAEDIYTIKETVPPNTYWTPKIFENDLVVVNLFILGPETKIPLHDHPNMHGIIKVLHGTIKITSFNTLDCSIHPDICKAKISRDGSHTRFSPPLFLSPFNDNIHEVSYESGENGDNYAAFIDVLSPPYSDDSFGSKISYYTRLENGTICTDSKNDTEDEIYQFLLKGKSPSQD